MPKHYRNKKQQLEEQRAGETEEFGGNTAHSGWANTVTAGRVNTEHAYDYERTGTQLAGTRMCARSV